MPKYRVTYRVEKTYEIDDSGIAENSNDKFWVQDTLYDLIRDDIVLSHEMKDLKFEEISGKPVDFLDHEKLRKLFRGEQ